jgi:hypothetical protein
MYCQVKSEFYSDKFQKLDNSDEYRLTKIDWNAATTQAS